MGDPAQYPEVRMARFLYAMQWLPPDFRADYQARQQWIDNNPHNTTRRYRGLAERSVTLNPFIRPSSIGPGQHAVYRHGDDPAMLSFEAITRNQRATDLALGQAGAKTEIHIIPRTDVRSSIDPIHAHSVDRFVDQPLPSITERTPLLNSRPTKTVSTLTNSRAGRVATSLGGAGLGMGVGVLAGAAVGGLGVTDPYANSGISGAFGNLAQEAIAGAGVATAAEAGVALVGGAAGGAGFVGGYELAKQLGANDVVATGAGIVTGTASQVAVAQSIGLATSAFEVAPAAAATAEGIELGVLGAEVVGESVALLGAEAAVGGLAAFAAADFWNPLGWIAAGAAASLALGIGIAKLSDPGVPGVPSQP